MKNKKVLLLVLIIFLAAFLRLYKLDKIPAALNWDEVDAGYNAYTIANWGRDEWGETLPLVFTSFRDDKHPIHIYSTALFVKLFGLSDFVTRLPSALLGILSVFLIYKIAFYMSREYLAAVLAAFFLAISPYHLHFSRGLWESNFALSFFLLGLTLFYKSLNSSAKFLNFSFLSFGISLLSYHSSKIVVLPLVFFLILLYFKELKKFSFHFYSALAIFLIFIGLLFVEPRLAGFARVKQTQFDQSQIEKTQVFQKTGNPLLGYGEIVFNGWISHFNPRYLFLEGDQTPRNSVKVFGQFYKVDAVFILVGLISLVILRSRISLVLFVWLILSPLPASLVVGAPNANRAIFTVGCLILISAYGAGKLINLFKNRTRMAILVIILLLVSFEAFLFIKYYLNIYPKKDPHDWVYGMKQIVEHVKENGDKYDQVFMTDARSQPYIYFLYYLKFPLTDYLRRAYYNTEESKSYNTVSNFEKYYFGGWDTVESMPQTRVLYILTPTQYDGLRHKAEFDVKKVILFPDGSTAFYIISSK